MEFELGKKYKFKTCADILEYIGVDSTGDHKFTLINPDDEGVIFCNNDSGEVLMFSVMADALIPIND